jgi:hypothetical protein
MHLESDGVLLRIHDIDNHHLDELVILRRSEIRRKLLPGGPILSRECEPAIGNFRGTSCLSDSRSSSRMPRSQERSKKGDRRMLYISKS